MWHNCVFAFIQLHLHLQKHFWMHICILWCICTCPRAFAWLCTIEWCSEKMKADISCALCDAHVQGSHARIHTAKIERDSLPKTHHVQSVNRASSTEPCLSFQQLPLFTSCQLSPGLKKKSDSSHLEFQLCQLIEKMQKELNLKSGICRAPQNWKWQCFPEQNHIYQRNNFCNAAVQQTFLYLWRLF